MEKECCCHKTKERDAKEYKDLCNRLSRIEGQIRGIKGMVEKDAYCIDILNQVSPTAFRAYADYRQHTGSLCLATRVLWCELQLLRLIEMEASDGFCHQEAPQADEQEEAPQTAA